jgi:hypothetical protein
MRMSTSEIVQEAWNSVMEAQLPEEVRQIAFREVLRFMLVGPDPDAKTRLNPRSKSAGSGAVIHKDGDGNNVDVDEAEVFAKIEHETGVSADKLERVVMIDDGVIKMVLPGKDLGRNTAEAARVVAQVLTVVGAYGLDRRDTEYEAIRKECDRLRVYDSKNFASKHLPNIPGFVTKGSGSARRLEAKALGVKAFSDVVDALVGTS